MTVDELFKVIQKMTSQYPDLAKTPVMIEVDGGWMKLKGVKSENCVTCDHLAFVLEVD